MSSYTFVYRIPVLLYVPFFFLHSIKKRNAVADKKRITWYVRRGWYIWTVGCTLCVSTSLQQNNNYSLLAHVAFEKPLHQLHNGQTRKHEQEIVFGFISPLLCLFLDFLLHTFRYLNRTPYKFHTMHRNVVQTVKRNVVRILGSSFNMKMPSKNVAVHKDCRNDNSNAAHVENVTNNNSSERE